MAITEKPLIILTGPTAVGKTALSIRLAKAIGGEIISADSMQVYRKLDIGSAKIMPSEMCGVPHHLIDILDPSEEFNVVKFKELAENAMNSIYANNHIPIVTGGTGFYIQALLNNIDFTDNDEDTSYRENMAQYAAEYGKEALFEKLREVDPKSCEVIHCNNVKRVIRALEFYHKTGQKISEHNEEERSKTSPYRFAYFVLNDERKKLYHQIELRIDRMLASGLIDEVKSLMESGCTKDMVSMQGLGYKEIIDYLEGNYSLEEAVYILKRDTRHFAKRQLTWFRRESEVIWVHKPDFNYNDNQILEFMLKTLNEKGILHD